MPKHIHAELMKLYAEDALETDKPWDRWERQSTVYGIWTDCFCTPTWKPSTMYRRKRTPLCQVEGKDVFHGDKLWHKAMNRFVEIGNEVSSSSGWPRDARKSVFYDPDFLSWTGQSRTKTVYQWAFLIGSTWLITGTFYETEEEVMNELSVSRAELRCLDYTALEVPA